MERRPWKSAGGGGRLRVRPNRLMTVEPRLNLHVNPGGGKRSRVGEKDQGGKGANQGQLELV